MALVSVAASLLVGCGGSNRGSAATANAASTSSAATSSTRTRTLAATIATSTSTSTTTTTTTSSRSRSASTWSPRVPEAADRVRPDPVRDQAQGARWSPTQSGTTGLRSYRLIDPHVIVIHFTETPDFQSTYNTFAPDTPDPELHELPNTCAHFVIDGDGSDPPARAARHHVPPHGRAELDRDRDRARRLRATREVLDDPRELSASLAARALAALPLPHRRRERDRPQREPLQPLPPRERPRAADPDARRFQPRRHGDLPREAAGTRRLSG